MYILGESGRVIRIYTGFDLSSNTNTVIKFTAPSGGTSFELNSADGVTAPNTDSPVLPSDNNYSGGAMPANHYMQYTTDGTEFDIAGDWLACVQYENNLSSPPDVYKSLGSTFTVTECC